MTKNNITKIEFNVYDGQRSDIPSVYTDTKHESFAYGDCFGHDGKAFWIDLNQDLNEHSDATSEHRKQYDIIKDLIEYLF